MKTVSYFSLLIALILVFGYILFTVGPKAVRGLFWNVSLANAQLVMDKYYCRFKPKQCVVDREALEQNFGVYDFNETFGKNTKLAFDHYFVNWNDTDALDNLAKEYTLAAKKDRWVLVTIEPYPQNEGNLFEQIQNGDFDATIKQICTDISNSPNPVFVRWGHEMENVTGRYPWAVDEPSTFIEAYNYFVSLCKKHTDNAYYVWSPAGDNGLDKYWPGEENVDYVGVSLYIYDEFEKDYYGSIRSFDHAFGERYERVKQFKKPIMIAEFGVINRGDLQKYWWYNASKSLSKYPELKTIVYFNAIDTVGVWGDYDTPDWSIDPAIFPGK